MGSRRGCKKKVFAGPCQNPPKAVPPRRTPAARRAAVAKAPPPKGKAQWSEEENQKADELYAQGGRDAKMFGEVLSKALKGSKSAAQCEKRYSCLKSVEPQQYFVFAYDKNDPKKHSAAIIAALPEEFQTLEKGEIAKLWEKKVEGKGGDAATALLTDARDRVFNCNLGKGDIQETIEMLSRAGVSPQFLKLKPKPPLRNSKKFRDAFDRLRRLAMNEKKHREAALDKLAGKVVPCDWGFLNPGEGRSDDALRQEMSKKACLLAALAEGANPLTQLPKGTDMADIKAMSIWPPFEAVASDAKHASCPSYARQFRCAMRGAFVTHPSRRTLWRMFYSLVSHRSALLYL